MIAIIDYGMGNLRSVQKAFEFLGCAAEIVEEPERLSEATHLVLPGDAAFGDAMRNLRAAWVTFCPVSSSALTISSRSSRAVAVRTACLRPPLRASSMASCSSPILPSLLEP